MLVAAGTVVGLAAAAASSRVLESFLYGVATDDRLTFVAAPLVLVAVALVACWLPAAARPGLTRCRCCASSRWTGNGNPLPGRHVSREQGDK